MAGRPRKSEAVLSLDVIIQQAWSLVDRKGIGELTTRNLAAELNVKQPALYWHFKNKDHLLNLMIEKVLEGTISGTPSDLIWPEWLFAVGMRQREALLAHRDSGLLAARATPTNHMRDEVFERAVEHLVQAGFTREDAASAFGGIARIVLGSVLYEQNEHTRAFAAAYGEMIAAFEYVLNAYIRGLEMLRADRSK